MCDSVASKRTAADYAEASDRDRAYARVRALEIAHNGDLPAEDVVKRANAYFAFIAEG